MNKILKTKEVLDMTSISRTTLWRLEKEGLFPKRIILDNRKGRCLFGYSLNDIELWMESRERFSIHNINSTEAKDD